MKLKRTDFRILRTGIVFIFPTLHDWAGIKIPEMLSGLSLNNELQWKIPDEHRTVYAHGVYGDFSKNRWHNPNPF